MSQVPVEQALQVAIAHHHAGRLQQAESIYRQILAVRPNHAEALNLLGAISGQLGRPDQAIDLIRRAIAAAPDNPVYHFHLGTRLQSQGRLDEATLCYQRAVALKPDYPEAHLNLGNVWRAKGQLDPAIACYQRALEIKPDYADAHNNLGNAWKDKGQLDQAIASYQRAIVLQSESAEAHTNLGSAWYDLGQLDKAIECYQRALELDPQLAAAHTNLGNAWRSKGQLDRSIACYQRALALQPDLVEVQVNLGVAWQETGQLDKAMACYQQALALKPDYAVDRTSRAVARNANAQVNPAGACYQTAPGPKPDLVEAFCSLGSAFFDKREIDHAIVCFQQALVLKPRFAEAHTALGLAWKKKGDADQAVECYQRALELDPELAAAHTYLGVVWSSEGQLDQAIACHQRALAIDPEFALACNNLGNAWKDVGRLDRAIECYQRAIAADPLFVSAYDNLLYAWPFHPDFDPKNLLTESRKWNQLHAQPLECFIRPHANDRNPERRLRVGYVSPDFRRHSVSFFMLPLLANHDRAAVEAYCYAQVPVPDGITAGLQSHADAWRNIVGLSDQLVADMIRHDQIDILVDLSLHMSNNRLLVFARKPAPVQVTWLGYPGTTGLATMDYRLTDPYLDPPGLHDALYSERTVHLPDTFWCYDPLSSEPGVGALPAASNGWITFGCMNNFCKVTGDALALWGRILNAAPRSRLILLAPQGSARQVVLDRLGQEGISPERIEFLDRQPRLAYLRTHSRIDITLDTFPVNGHTTSLDSLWMGVPVVTLVGRDVLGRAGLSQLMNMGLAELIARTSEDYVRIAGDLAADLPRLSELRATLRQRMQNSPLMDAPRFARGIETAYRTMWRTWCAQ